MIKWFQKSQLDFWMRKFLYEPGGVALTSGLQYSIYSIYPKFLILLSYNVTRRGPFGVPYYCDIISMAYCEIIPVV